MTPRELLDWLAARQPTRPAALAERMDRAVAATAPARLAGVPTTARALGAVGVAMLADLVRLEPQAEGLALDLLAADAFVTYAFEAAAEQGESIAALAHDLVGEAAR
jgi:hypothetical protein